MNPAPQSTHSESCAAPLRAYVVTEDFDGNCAIAFASNNASARRHGGAEIGVEFAAVSSCKRAPEFDIYSPGPVPMAATLAAGWWHTCLGCHVKFDATGRRGEPYTVIAGEPHSFMPIEVDGYSTYCCPACEMSAWAAARHAEKLVEAQVLACLLEWPSANRVLPVQTHKPRPFEPLWRYHVYLPFLEHSVEWSTPPNSNEAQVLVAAVDVAAYTGWVDAGRPANFSWAPDPQLANSEE